MTFEQLDLLLRQVSEGMDGSSDWPPPQEKECMVVATLNLLRLQVDGLPTLVSLKMPSFNQTILSNNLLDFRSIHVKLLSAAPCSHQ